LPSDPFASQNWVANNQPCPPMTRHVQNHEEQCPNTYLVNSKAQNLEAPSNILPI